ncbi:MAG: MaoC/PaaZ C-terminal domain-containing protein [Candidatus Promineifilaceae bacterium]|nr:MaoC/PaaZ C-terminal domain-containing protein [Candidatus Promineifilaceae bacterium]
METKQDLSHLVGYELTPTTLKYDERDVMLYALGVGGGADPLDREALRFVYEHHPRGLMVLPTFAATFGYEAMWQILGLPGLSFNPMMLLHGEQMTEVPKPLPAAATVVNRGEIGAVYDKGKGALFLLDVTSEDGQGRRLAFNRYSLFIRGLGGWGGERGPSGGGNQPPDRAPDAVVEEHIPEDQALLYRLSGDRNPLHADPQMAAVAGFERPILHGLCTLGFAARALLAEVVGQQAEYFRRIQCRFSSHVFPGETLLTQLWREEEGRVFFQCRVAEREVVVLSNAVFAFHGSR